MAGLEVCIVGVCFDMNFPDTWSCKQQTAIYICRAILNFIGSVLSVFFLWLIFFRPYKVRPHVDGATLAAFDLVSDPAGPALRYNLAMNVTFFNDHRIYSIRFDHLTVGLYYNGTKLGPSDDTAPSFSLRPRRHRTVQAALRGQEPHVGVAVEEELSREQAQGRVSLDVRMKTTLMYIFWPTRAVYYYEYSCWLQSPAPNKTGPPVMTGGVKCGVRK